MHGGLSLFTRRTTDVTMSDGVETGATECVGVCERQTRKCLFFKMSSPARKPELKCSAATGLLKKPWTQHFDAGADVRNVRRMAQPEKANALSSQLYRRSDARIQQKDVLTACSSLTLRSLAHYLFSALPACAFREIHLV